MFHNFNTILQKITQQAHGVHSPFAYSFSKNVVFAKRKSDNLSKFPGLLFRIAEHFNPETILIVGITEPEILNAFEKAAPNSQIIKVPEVDGNRNKDLSETNEIELAFFSKTLAHNEIMHFFEIVSDQCNPKSVLIIDGIRKDKISQQAWNAIITHPKPTIKLDFNKFGMVFFDPKFSKELIKVGF